MPLSFCGGTYDGRCERTRGCPWVGSGADGLFLSAGVSVPLQLGLPDAIPPQYGALKEVSIHTVRARLRLLYHFSDLMYSSWRLLNLSPNNQVRPLPLSPYPPCTHPSKETRSEI